MKLIANCWRIVLALLLVAAAAALYFLVYIPEVENNRLEESQLNITISSLNFQIAQDKKYESVRGELDAAIKALNESRLELYKHFPVELREEDQIMYVLYLEQKFGKEITFSFSQPQAIAILSDGATLQGLTLSVNYECSYKRFKEMVKFLSTDSRIASVQMANVNYDAKKDKASGNISITLYLIDSKDLEYQPPKLPETDTGKDNIFD